jgi:hypothetical protein
VAALALAAYAINKIGTYIYYRMTRTVAKRTVTVDKPADFEFSVLREFNAATLHEDLTQREQNLLLRRVHDGISDLADQLTRRLVSDVNSAMCLTEHLSEELSKLANQPLTSMQETAPHTYEMFMQNTQTTVERSIKNQYVAAEILSITQSYMAKSESLLYTTLKAELSKKPLQRRPRTVPDVLGELTEQIAYVQLAVLRKIVEATCRSFGETYMDIVNNFDAHLELNDADSTSEASVSSSLPSTSPKHLSSASSLSSSEPSPKPSPKPSPSSSLVSSPEPSPPSSLVSSPSPAPSSPPDNTVGDLWSDSLQKHFATLVSRDVSRTFCEPLLRRFDAYMRKSATVSKESPVYRKALDSDVATKRERQTFEKVVQAKSQNQFLEREMQQVCAECWDVRRDASVLQCMISNKYPLPISAASSVRKAVEELLRTTMSDVHEFRLILCNSKREVVYAEGKEDGPRLLQLTLILHDDHFYAARGAVSKLEVIGTACFVYEGLCAARATFGLIFHSADEFVAELIAFFSS